MAPFSTFSGTHVIDACESFLGIYDKQACAPILEHGKISMKANAEGSKGGIVGCSRCTWEQD